MTDLSLFSVRELLRLRSEIASAFRERGLARTNTSLLGELSEKIVQSARGGDLARASQKAFDVIDRDGCRIQVKSTSSANAADFFSFSSFDFDIAVMLSFDPVSFDMTWASEMTSQELREASYYDRGLKTYDISHSKARKLGTDVTVEMRVSYDAL
ncbi:DUF6998 domain-containing protein [Bifidobacterium psychraerophilum]|nr:hypothetical protein [Bifidobacterium psychraerophilum]MCI1660086.1 hypothetical protein [Bifidobacterium psychraerophilum]MCI1803802.1 hypothetical protein [Bifidobacterium psychraerophilum]